MSIIDWSTTAANNTGASPNGWPENMAPSQVNDVGRQMMADIRSGVLMVVNTKALMSAIPVADVATGDRIYVKYRSAEGDDGGGVFRVTKTDISANVTADTLGGIYVPFDSDITGASGGFVRVINNESVNVKQFGAVGDGVTDDAAAIQAAIDSGYSVTGYLNQTFAIAKSLFVKDNSKLNNIKLTMVGDRSNFTISAIVNENYSAAATGNTGIEISDVEITGFSTVQQTDATTIIATNKGIGGVYLAYITNSRVTRVKTIDTWSGIVVYQTPTGIDNRLGNNSVKDCIITRAQGYSATGNTGAPRGVLFGTGGTMSGCISTDSATGFYVSGTNATAFNNTAVHWYKDDGFYILGVNLKILNNNAYGNSFGNGFAVAYNEGSIVDGNYATGCSNMGIRVHCPQRDTTIVNNHLESNGYGIRIENSITISSSSITRSGTTATFTATAATILAVGDFVLVTGAAEPEYNGVFQVTSSTGSVFTYEVAGTPATPATGTPVAQYTSQGLNISNNISQSNSVVGIQLSYLINSVVNGNICIANNTGGIAVSTRGAIALYLYCNNNILKDNKCYDYQATPTQTFGMYDYNKSVSGAIAENTGNDIVHKSQTGTDYYRPISLTGTSSATILSGAAVITGSVTFAQVFEAAPHVFIGVTNSNVFPDSEKPISATAYNITTTGFSYSLNSHTVTAANRAINIAWRADKV